MLEILRNSPGKGILTERLLVAVAALITTYFFFYDYLPPFKRLYLWADIAGYHHPLQQYAFQELKEGRIPQWDSSIYCGISFVGNVQAALLYPPTWLMYAGSWALARFPFKALEAMAFLHVWLAFLLCYLWLRGRTGKLASALGAAVFAFTGYLLYQLLHPGVFGAMTWIPLGLWGVDEAVQRRSWRPLWKVAAASALAFLAGYPAAWLVHCATVFVYAFGSRALWSVPRVSAALALSPLLFLVQLLPSLEARALMVLEPKYGVGAYGWRTLLLSYFLPNWFDFNPGHPTTYDPGCLYLYLGLPALFAVGWAIRRHQLRPYLQPVAVAAVALVLANPPGLLIKAVEQVPVLNNTMQPFNFYAAVAAMAALITALGLDDFLRRPDARGGRLAVWFSPVAVVGLAAWSARQLWIWAHGGAFAAGGRSVGEAAVALVLFSLGLWSVRAAAGSRRILAGAMLLLAAGVDYRVFGAGRWFNAIEGDVDSQQLPYGIAGVDDAAYRAMMANRQYRVVTAGTEGPASTDYRRWGLATPEGFDPFISLQYKQAIERWVPFSTNRLFHTDLQNEVMLQALGVRYVLVRNGVPQDLILAADPKYRLVGAKDIFCHVYEYLRAKPAYHWEENDSRATVEAVSWTPGRREFLVRSETGGRFVLVEQFFPGWKATVDQHPVQIERSGIAFQAIQVGAGQHQVVFQFDSRGFRIGTVVSLLAMVALTLVALSAKQQG